MWFLLKSQIINIRWMKMEMDHLMLILTNLKWKLSNWLSVISTMTKIRSFHYKSRTIMDYTLSETRNKKSVPNICQPLQANKIQIHKKCHCIHPVLYCHASSRTKKEKNHKWVLLKSKRCPQERFDIMLASAERHLLRCPIWLLSATDYKKLWIPHIKFI